MTSLISRKTLNQVAHVLGVDAVKADASFSQVNIDTRTLRPGDLFIALQGPNFDGHQFIDQAYEKDAAGAVVQQAINSDLPLLQVSDTHAALGVIAKDFRRGFKYPLIGVTGSNGKTTVKEMLNAILSLQGSVLATKGNFNNDIGLPLTLCRLELEDRYAVIEMGANHPGEIAYLTGIAQPTIGLITNAGAAHLEGFGSVEGVAHAKGELFQNLDSNATAVINVDDHYAPLWKNMSSHCNTILFSTKQSDVDFYASNIEMQVNASQFLLHSPETQVEINLQLAGTHNVLNAVAAAAAAWCAGATIEVIQQALGSFSAYSGRLNVKQGWHGATVIDDAYNANPDSVRAGIDVLSRYSGQTILVLGDMLEAGHESESMHAQIGEYAQQLGINFLFAYGEQASISAQAFGIQGKAFADQKLLCKSLEEIINSNTTVLVKGSHSMHMENVVARLCEEANGDIEVVESE
ncbi:MAG: UDP-N-acetylmuramoyl-tripeptide--D-alanyl-D-alanine ligase [Gammaproteobacteria bacterium]|nr:UDP-N-acetylmuramoyl-tripeptide--D-alanyl-D-alanine ligase [Gammaproteobacteria bacterium]